jgi:hypothetical protein
VFPQRLFYIGRRSREVVLQTLMIKLKGENGRERRVIALIDSSSQRSYVLKGTVQELGYQPKGSERATHVLFGGGRSEEQNLVQLEGM